MDDSQLDSSPSFLDPSPLSSSTRVSETTISGSLQRQPKSIEVIPGSSPAAAPSVESPNGRSRRAEALNAMARIVCCNNNFTISAPSRNESTDAARSRRARSREVTSVETDTSDSRCPGDQPPAPKVSKKSPENKPPTKVCVAASTSTSTATVTAAPLVQAQPACRPLSPNPLTNNHPVVKRISLPVNGIKNSLHSGKADVSVQTDHVTYGFAQLHSCRLVKNNDGSKALELHHRIKLRNGSINVSTEFPPKLQLGALLLDPTPDPLDFTSMLLLRESVGAVKALSTPTVPITLDSLLRNHGCPIFGPDHSSFQGDPSNHSLPDNVWTEQKLGSFIQEKLTIPFIMEKSNEWEFVGEPTHQPYTHVKTMMTVLRRTYEALRKKDKIIRVSDSVLLKSSSRRRDLPYVARVSSIWEENEGPHAGQPMITVLWYYRSREMMSTIRSAKGQTLFTDEMELFASRHIDDNTVACIQDKCYVLSFQQYCRFHAKRLRLTQRGLRHLGVLPERSTRSGQSPPPETDPSLVYFCRAIYDFKNRRVTMKVKD